MLYACPLIFSNTMKHYSIKPDIYCVTYGVVYRCNHCIYSECTLFLIKTKGLAIIQQRYDEKTKRTYWGPIDEWLNNILYTAPKFIEVFTIFAKEDTDGIYPTLTIRQLMWRLRLKPLPKKPWETVFDHSPL